MNARAWRTIALARDQLIDLGLFKSASGHGLWLILMLTLSSPGPMQGLQAFLGQDRYNARRLMKKTLFTLAPLCILLAVTSAHAQINWKTYRNTTYGYSIPMPANLQLQPWKGDPASPWQARTKTFQSKDGNISLVISTHWTNGRTPQEFFNDEVSARQKEGALINYSVLKDNWFVVSGTNSLGFEYYTKCVVFGDEATGQARYVEFTFAYPTSQRSVYDRAVTKMSREFVPDMPGDYDRE